MTTLFRPLVLLLVLALGLAFPAVACADVLLMKDGRRIEGTVVQQTRYTLTFESKGIRYYFKMEDVQEVQTEGDAPPESPARATPTPAPQPSAESPQSPPGPATPAASEPAAPATPARPAHTSPIPPGFAPPPPSADAARPAAAAAREAPLVLVKPEGPSYFVIPLEGEVGVEMTAELVDKSLKYAEELKPEVIILEINSPGGYVAEMVPIMDMLVRWQTRHKDVRVVALVREQALSAAAIIAMACKEIYMMPGTTIGAAMIINMEGDRISRVKEKFESAIRAKARTVAQFGGHNPAIVEAMMEPAIELWLQRGEDGSPAVVRGPIKPEDAEARGMTLVDAADKLLTLTPQEAIEIGLVRAMVDDVEGLLQAMDEPDLIDAGDYARVLREQHQREIENITQEFENLTTAIRRRQASNVLGGTLDDLYRQRNELRRIKLTIDKIEKLAAPHSMMSQFIEDAYGDSFESIRMEVDRQMAWCEDAIRELQYRARRR